MPIAAVLLVVALPCRWFGWRGRFRVPTTETNEGQTSLRGWYDRVVGVGGSFRRVALSLSLLVSPPFVRVSLCVLRSFAFARSVPVALRSTVPTRDRIRPGPRWADTAGATKRRQRVDGEDEGGGRERHRPPSCRMYASPPRLGSSLSPLDPSPFSFRLGAFSYARDGIDSTRHGARGPTRPTHNDYSTHAQ